MNMVSTFPEPESATQPSTARQHAVRPLPLWSRVLHQSAQELRRQRLLVLLMWLLPVASLVLRSAGLGSQLLTSYIIGPISVTFCVVLVCRCVWASSAARAEILVHTQPVGRMTVILAQGLFIFLAAVVPWVLLDMVVGMGFGYTVAQWFQLMLGSVLIVCLPTGLSAAWMSAARTHRQQGVIFTVTVLVWWGAVLLFGGMGRRGLLDWLDSDRVSSDVQLEVHLISAGLLGLALWVLQSLLHRRRVMMYAALAGGVVLAFITLIWPWDWKRADPMPYTGGTPKLVLHGADQGHQPGMSRLWPGVIVEGLQPEEAAIIASFHHRGLRFPTSFSDADDRGHADDTYGSTRVGVDADMARSIGGALPSGWLMSDDGRLSARLPLPQVWKSVAQDLARVSHEDSWLLNLAIVQPRMVAEFPLSEILGREKTVLLEPGLCIAIGENRSSQAFLQLWMQEVERRPIFLKTPPDRNPSSGMLKRKLYVLLLDDSRRMAHMEVTQAITRNPHATGIPGMTFATNSYYQTLQVDGPEPRMQLTGLTREQWISSVRVQIWWPEPKGFYSLSISGSEAKRMAKGLKK